MSIIPQEKKNLSVKLCHSFLKAYQVASLPPESKAEVLAVGSTFVCLYPPASAFPSKLPASAHSDSPDSLPRRALGAVPLWNIPMSTEHLSTSYLCPNMTSSARLSFLYSCTVSSNSAGIKPCFISHQGPYHCIRHCAVRTYSVPCCMLPIL